jgi:hypothetical protein
VTVPTGYSPGPNGFSAGLPTYMLGYSLVFNLSNRVGVSTTQNFILNAAPLASGSSAQFFTYQPALSGSYAFSPNVTFLLQDQFSFSASPAAASGNRALVGLQDSISANVVLDLDFETNLLPEPGVNQHAVDAGITILP